jgi:hypothetical protein
VYRPKQGACSSSGIEWELDLIRKKASTIRTSEREDLEAELGRRLIVLKGLSPSHIRHWEPYVKGFLRKKTANWIRDCRASEARKVAIVELDEDESEGYLATGVSPSSVEENLDLRIAFAEMWRELDPELRAVWETLDEERGNQTAVARRLGKHRNTIRLWIRKIHELLKRHGFGGVPPF